MATLQIVEFGDTQIIDGQAVPVAKSVLAVQNVSYTTATSSAAFQKGCKMIRVLPVTDDARVDLAGDAAVATSMLMKGDQVEYFGTEGGRTISVYDGSS